VLKSSFILFSIIPPDSIDTLSGLKGERPLAISSAFTNSLQFKISGKIVKEAFVFRAPLQPEIMKRFYLSL